MVVARVVARLGEDARRQPLLNPLVDPEGFAEALRSAMGQTWVAIVDGRLVGHLYGARLESPEYGRGAWIGPDGVSFDSPDVLAELYSTAGAAWIEDGALEHYAWVFDDLADVGPWYELGFARMHQRGVLALAAPRRHQLPRGYSLRRGGRPDLAIAVDLDHVLDQAQQRGPSFALFVDHSSRAEELAETLEDNEVHYYVVEHDGQGIAQCLTFPLEARRGSFDHSVHLSAVAVRPEHQGQGVATALVDHALNDALAAGFRYVETNWRVTNQRAARFWRNYGFSPTYVRLHRAIGSG